MSFPAQVPSFFTRRGIEALNPNQSGCYGLIQANHLIYVGRAQCLRARLLEHFERPAGLLVGYMPTHFVTVVCPDPISTEKALISFYRPVCNQRVG
jgi:excinuclease UvrABC nuclease subunit